MKKRLTLIALLFLPVIAMAQKKAEVRFQTDGVCGMCEKRIETALLAIDGVWTADWDRESHETYVVFNPKKVKELALHQAVAAVGHDTPQVKAKDEDYAKVHACCKYRNEDVTKSHR